jgi:hypothetical protein
MLPGLLALVRAAVELAEAEVTVGDERRMLISSEAQRLALARCSFTRFRRIPAFRDCRERRSLSRTGAFPESPDAGRSPPR